MKDWEWGLMKGKRKDKSLVALNETVVFEKSSYIYIFCINCHITILVWEWAFMIIAICKLLLLRIMLRSLLDYMFIPRCWIFFRCWAECAARFGSSYLLATGPLLYWRNAICVKGLHPSSWLISDVSPRAIYLACSCCIYIAYKWECCYSLLRVEYMSLFPHVISEIELS